MDRQREADGLAGRPGYICTRQEASAIKTYKQGGTASISSACPRLDGAGQREGGIDEAAEESIEVTPERGSDAETIGSGRGGGDSLGGY